MVLPIMTAPACHNFALAMQVKYVQVCYCKKENECQKKRKKEGFCGVAVVKFEGSGKRREIRSLQRLTGLSFGGAEYVLSPVPLSVIKAYPLEVGPLNG